MTMPAEPARKTPRVSVLMTMFDAARYLRPAIESVLAQTFRDFEFLIVDDGSRDDSAAIAASYDDPRIRLIPNLENRGQTVCLNQGLTLARGEFVARLDADDLAQPERLRRQVEFLDAHPGVALVGSEAEQIDPAGHVLERVRLPADTLSIRWANLFDNSFLHSAVVFRTALVRQEFGGYDESFRCSQDYALWSRIARRHEVANLAEPLVRLRAHPDSMMRTQSTRLVEEADRIQRDNLAAQFPDRAFREDEFALLRQFRFRVAPETLRAFRALREELLLAFRKAWPETQDSAEFRRTLARQHERIGYNLLDVSRRDGLAELARAVRVFPPVALEIPWMRVAALAVFGETARALHRWIFSNRPG